jgi:hypothetical protein
LDNLFISTGLNFYYTLVILFARFGDTENMLPDRRVSQYDPPRTSDAALAFVIDINFGSDRRKNYEARYTCLSTLIHVRGRILKLFDPFRHGRRTICRIDLERPHYRVFDISRDVRAK